MQVVEVENKKMEVYDKIPESWESLMMKLVPLNP